MNRIEMVKLGKEFVAEGKKIEAAAVKNLLKQNPHCEHFNLTKGNFEIPQPTVRVYRNIAPGHPMITHFSNL